MEELIELPVHYNGQVLHFNLKVLAFGYVYKLSVDVEGTEVLFEPDEQRNYRAMLADPDSLKKVDKNLVKAIADTLSSLRASFT